MGITSFQAYCARLQNLYLPASNCFHLKTTADRWRHSASVLDIAIIQRSGNFYNWKNIIKKA